MRVRITTDRGLVVQGLESPLIEVWWYRVLDSPLIEVWWYKGQNHH